MWFRGRESFPCIDEVAVLKKLFSGDQQEVFLQQPTSMIKTGLLESSPIPIDILLVDDREENLLALEAVLKSSDYRIVKTQSGDQALRYLLDHTPPALIVMDVQMPGLDGFETAAIIKGGARTREIPIIFITALNKDERYLYKGYEHGAVDYIYKPFDAQILRSKVAVFADLHRKSERLIRTERLLRETETRERERRIAELEIKALRREQIEQRRYRDLVDGINHGVVWSADPETLSITFASDAAKKLSGFDASHWQENPGFFLEHIFPEDHAAFISAVKAAVESGTEQRIEHRFITADRGIIWLQTGLRASARVNDLDSEIRGLSVDVTKLKEAEKTLLRSKNRSDLLAKASLILGESLDGQNRMNAISRFAVDQFADLCLIDWLEPAGQRRSIAFGGRLQDFEPSCREAMVAELELEKSFQPDEKPEFFSDLDQEGLLRIFGNPDHVHPLRACGLHTAVRAPLISRGRRLGTIILGSASEENRFYPDDVYFLEDFSYRVASAVENARLYLEAESAIRVRDEFLAIASHELRTPLTPLKLQAQQLTRMIRIKGESAINIDSITRMVATTNRQVERLAKLIDSLLDITRISRGKLTLNPVKFELAALLQDVTSRLSSDLESARCELKMEVEPGVSVQWDNFRMEQVVENLVSNALKYAQGKPIELKAWAAGDEVNISVRDFGIGISAEDQHRIFKRFERAVSSSHFGGLGLGLYIVSQIIDAHKGTISVESEVGKGSCFLVTMPKSVEANESPSDSAAS